MMHHETSTLCWGFKGQVLWVKILLVKKMWNCWHCHFCNHLVQSWLQFEMFFVKFYWNDEKLTRPRFSCPHSMARANLNESNKLVTNITAASKYIPRRPRICINWNLLFQTSLHKIFKNCFLWSKSCLTMFTKKILAWKGDFNRAS